MCKSPWRSDSVFVKNNKYNNKIYETLYKIYAVLGDVDSAIIILKKVVTIETENLKAWSSLIFCLNYSEDYSQKEYINFSKKFSKNIKIYNEEKTQLLNLSNQLALTGVQSRTLFRALVTKEVSIRKSKLDENKTTMIIDKKKADELFYVEMKKTLTAQQFTKWESSLNK